MYWHLHFSNRFSVSFKKRLEGLEGLEGYRAEPQTVCSRKLHELSILDLYTWLYIRTSFLRSV